MRFRVKRILQGEKRCGARGEKGHKREKSKKKGAGSGLAPRALVLIRVFCQNTRNRPLCSTHAYSPWENLSPPCKGILIRKQLVKFRMVLVKIVFYFFRRINPNLLACGVLKNERLSTYISCS